MAQMKGKMNILCFLAAFFAMYSCGSGNATETKEPVNNDTVVMQQDTVEIVQADSATFYSDVVNQKNCFILISKPEYRLYVCEVVDGDTLKRAHFPVCVGKAKGQKQKKGDMKTPECTVENLSYGHWFMRLKTPGHSGIGIHGSTNNESSVPGRGSEGCIRLRDNDLIQLKEKYAFVGMRVVILPDVE